MEQQRRASNGEAPKSAVTRAYTDYSYYTYSDDDHRAASRDFVDTTDLGTRGYYTTRGEARRSSLEKGSKQYGHIYDFSNVYDPKGGLDGGIPLGADLASRYVYNKEQKPDLWRSGETPRLSGYYTADGNVMTYYFNASLNTSANRAFLATNAQNPNVTVTSSGLQYRVVSTGAGKRPTRFDRVVVNYTIRLIDGDVVDSTGSGAAAYSVGVLVPGWAEALLSMREGDHWQLVIPPKLAYGPRGAGGGAIPPNQTLVADLTLLQVIKTTK